MNSVRSGIGNFTKYALVSSFFLLAVMITPGSVKANQYFSKLYDVDPQPGILDGTEKSFLVNGYSTSASPDEENAWPAVLQKMLDDHVGATVPEERVYHVFSHTVGSTPIAWWSAQNGDLGCGDGSYIDQSLSWYVNPGTQLTNGAPPAKILLAQQSLQWAFDCQVREAGIANENDLANIEHGADEIEYFVDQFVAGGIEQVYMASHIYQKNELSVPTFTEQYGLIRALDFVEELRPGPYLWWATEHVYPDGYNLDGRHPNLGAANTMAVYWYLVLAGDDADPDIVNFYANQYSPTTWIPSSSDPPRPPAENITNTQTVLGTQANYELVIDDDPYGYGIALPQRLYTDYTHDLDLVPEYLLGQTFIMTSNEDRTYAGEEFLSFETDQDVTVYVFFHSKINPVPAWLASFVDTGDDVGSGRYAFDVYAKDFSAGTVTLGGNAGGSKDRMYAVAIVNHPPTNASPAAADDAYSVEEDFSLQVASEAGVIVNDSDPEGDPLTAQLQSDPANGVVILASDGSFSYYPNLDFYGIDTFTYAANDGTSLSNTATVTITVDPVNDPPAAVDDNASTPQDTSVGINVLANDNDPDGDLLDVVSVSQPASGSAVINTDDTITYTPDVGFSGTDTFDYEITDGEFLATASATIFINQPPSANDQNVVTDEDTSVAITLSGEDLDGIVVDYGVDEGPAHGELTGTAPDLAYDPFENYHGSDSFSFTVIDDKGAYDTGTVFITVNPVNDAPVAQDGSASTDEGVAVDIVLSASDIEGDDLDYNAVDLPLNGTLTSLDGDELVTYTPNSGFSGQDSFTFTVNDGLVDSSLATVLIEVFPSGPVVSIVSVSTGANYAIGTAQLGELVYTDSSYTINSITSLLDGKDLVQTTWSDRGVSTSDHLTLSFSKDVDVYIAMDKRLNFLPSWMNDGSWSLTGESVSTTYGSDSPRLVYKKSFSAGQHTLGGNHGQSTGARSTYFLIVIPSV